jgi:hemolysin III
MQLFDLREPVNAWSHGAGMMLALPVTWVLWQRSGELIDLGNVEPWRGSTRYQRIKALCLLIFGINLILCYGISATYHAVQLSGESLRWLQRLDHVGIYLLIAGTYTPVAWAMMRGSWWWGTLATVWTVALVCAARVWCVGILPPELSTLVYLTMGWGSVFCYRELARTYSHRSLLPLPLGGIFYSIGAVINLAHWPVIYPGVFAAHELFHFFVIAGSACHVFFMHDVVVPTTAREPALLSPTPAANAPQPIAGLVPASVSQAGRSWTLHLPARTLWGRDRRGSRTGIKGGDPLAIETNSRETERRPS